MWQLASAFGAIALRRRGPEILPDSSFLVGFLLAVSVLLSLLSLLVHGALSWRSVANLAAQLALLFAFVFAVLRFFRLERRYRQTISAFLGINIVLYSVYVPLTLAGLVLGGDLTGAFFVYLQLVLFLWSIIIEATILARALSQPLVLGFMVEILYVLPLLSISEYFSPAVE